MIKEGLIEQLKTAHRFFRNSASSLEEMDSGFAPGEGMMTVVQQVAHAAQSVEWFMQGGFGSEGFDMDFEKLGAATAKVQSLPEAMDWFDRAFASAIGMVEGTDDVELAAPLPEGPILGGAPRLAVVNAVVDHTAHHRGSIATYTRLLGKQPKMPYDD
jgi:uncharacterized damage-inducible protein DinB